MTKSRHPKLLEKYQNCIDSYSDHPGWREFAMLSYRHNLGNEIGVLINAPDHISPHFPLERLEKAWLILNGIEE